MDFHSLKLLASLIASIVAVVAYIPYVIDMIRGRNHPHLYTWICTFIITAVVASLQVAGGAGVGAIPTILGVAADAVILFYCLKYGTKDIVFMDKVCLSITLLGVLLYIILHSLPAISLATVTTAEVISFLPTFRKTRNNPYSESLPSYYLIILKCGLILVALQKYNLLTASYPVVWIMVFVYYLLCVNRWRKGKKPESKTVPEVPIPI